MDDATQRFPARFDCLPQALAFAAAVGAGAGLSPEQCNRIELVIEELFTNTLDYGYPACSTAGAEQTIRLAARASATGVEIVYEDAAPPFDPTAPGNTPIEERISRHEVGGLGRVLINSLPTAAKYERRNGLNRIILRFDR